MRHLMIGTGWKMNLGIRDSLDYIDVLLPKVESVSEVDIFIVPSFIALDQVGQALKNSNVQFGAQNLFWQEKGAFTGEISPVMLTECGCQYAEVGHWERRRLFAETNETVGLKTRAAWDHGLIPIICIGEDIKPVAPQDAAVMLKAQLQGALGCLKPQEVAQTVLAYEPAWAIGTGKAAADPVYANQIHGLVRAIVMEMFGKQIADAVRIIYGGSVDLDNARGFLQQAEIDGLFVGRAALNPNVFAEMVHLGLEFSFRKK